RYLGLPDLPSLWLETNADVAALARLIDNLCFPGVEIADAATETPEMTFYFRCKDKQDKIDSEKNSFSLLSFYYDWQSGRFQDPLGVYPVLVGIKKKQKLSLDETWVNPNAVREDCCRVIMDAALLLARYGFEAGTFVSDLAGALGNYPPESPLPEIQRAFINCLLVSPRPDAALEFLKSSGLLNVLWPELSCLDDVDHSKEFHPEGNAWNHTLETFRHRKAGSNGAFDLRLSLGLLLHDMGKPVSASYGNRRFDGHAELGARAAARFLKRLEYEPSIVDDVFFLVKNHMLPAALKRLPLTKTKEIMTSPLFPTLMELYRCDELSSFKVLDGYYENSAAYQAYLRNLRNPYRSSDGKKLSANTRRRHF
ncbi:MAG: HD domain-containing protein, partial [Treponema sp.]|nr:HD domain-containing protein [Treponema sp.]